MPPVLFHILPFPMDEISFLSLSEIQDTADNAKDTVGKHHDPGNGSGACAEKARERTRDIAPRAHEIAMIQAMVSPRSS